MKRAFEVKQKTFFQVSQVLSFRLEKQTSKNVADTTFKGLKKAPKLNYQVLHPGNNEGNFKLAIARFDETTISAVWSYFLDRSEQSIFHLIINICWTILNTKQQFSPNLLGGSIFSRNSKTDSLVLFTKWLKNWASVIAFSLTVQTLMAMIQTECSQAVLIAESPVEGYVFLL